MKPLKIFLCHSSDDKAEVKNLYDQLAKRGSNPWLDSEKLLPGQNWNLEINRALDDADVILICLSRKSVNKEGYVQREMRIAIDHALEIPEGRIFLIPTLLEECELPYQIRAYQRVDLFSADGMNKLIMSLNLRAKEVKAQPLSTDGAAPVVKKSAPKKKIKPKQAPANTTINIQGNLTGSNIVIGNDNDVNI